MAHDEILLADAIEALRAQLSEAMKAGEGKDVRFRVEDLELELQAVVTREATGKTGAKGGIKFWLVSGEASAEVGGKVGSSSVQRIKLRLKPVGPDGSETELAG